MAFPFHHLWTHLFVHPSSQLSSSVSSLSVWPLLRWGPPGEEVLFPAAAPGGGLIRGPDWEPNENRLQTRLFGPNYLRLRHQLQQLELWRGDPASRCHPSQVTNHTIAFERNSRHLKRPLFHISKKVKRSNHFDSAPGETTPWIVIRQSVVTAGDRHGSITFSLCQLILPFMKPVTKKLTFWGYKTGTVSLSQQKWGRANFELVYIIL